MQTYWTTPFKMRCLHQVRCNPATDYGLLDSYEYDDYDRLIQLLDSTCNADGTKNLEKLMGKDLNTVLQ